MDQCFCSNISNISKSKNHYDICTGKGGPIYGPMFSNIKIIIKNINKKIIMIFAQGRVEQCGLLDGVGSH